MDDATRRAWIASMSGDPRHTYPLTTPTPAATPFPESDDMDFIPSPGPTPIPRQTKAYYGSLAEGVPFSSSPIPPHTPIASKDMPLGEPFAEPRLCPEQEALVELIASGRNVFYTGSAGCGKSTVLAAFKRRLAEMGKRVHVIAPTGRAALQVGGSTTWTYAGWTPDHHKRPLERLRKEAHGKFVWKRFDATDVLVIDEISMVENLHFERLNEVMKEARYDPMREVQPAFGGVQVVVTGDFCQLPPVKPFQHCMECGRELIRSTHGRHVTYACKQQHHGSYRDEDKWAFRSKAWEECAFVNIHLKTIHRQNDQTFIGMLQKCRIGVRLAPPEIDLLMNHKCTVHNGTRLYATREEVRNVNEAAFKKLKTQTHEYWCRDTFIWRPNHPHLERKGWRCPYGPPSQRPLEALRDHRFDECVKLKQGMLVVLLVNLDLQAGLCNGSQGLICGFQKPDDSPMPKRFGSEQAEMKEAEVRAFIRGEGAKIKKWPVVRFHNGVVRPIPAQCSVAELGDEKPYCLLSRTQIPLAPAWAMTIHKSQSLTMDRVIVNLSKAFEEGQVYVALSRATGLTGLKIEGDAAGLLVGLGGNPEVQEFLRERFEL